MPEKKIRVLIVDDEPTARRGVRLLVGRDSDLLVVGESSSGSEAVRRILEEKPDVIFLDVQMPEMNGFKVLETVGSRHSAVVIFVTAHDKHVVQAFEVSAVDYLLKPYEDERFWSAVRRAKSEISRRQTDVLGAKVSKLLSFLQAGGGEQSVAGAAVDAPTSDRILVKSGGEIFFLKADEIDWIEASGDYMKFHAGGRTHLLRETMVRLEARLDQNRFIRIHRSTIVNIDRVRKLSPSFAGEYAVVLHDGSKLKLSRGYHDRLQQLLKSAL